jgi:hypothetical protein
VIKIFKKLESFAFLQDLLDLFDFANLLRVLDNLAKNNTMLRANLITHLRDGKMNFKEDQLLACEILNLIISIGLPFGVFGSSLDQLVLGDSLELSICN